METEYKGVVTDYLVGRILDEKILNRYVSSKSAGDIMSYVYKKPELEDRKIEILES